MPHTNKEEGEKKEICGKIVSSGTGKIDGHACFNEKPCPIHSPSPTEEKKGEATGEIREKIFQIVLDSFNRMQFSETAVDRIMKIFNQIISTTEQSVREEIIKKIESVDLQVFDKSVKSDVISFYKDAMEETKRIILAALSPQEHTKE